MGNHRRLEPSGCDRRASAAGVTASVLTAAAVALGAVPAQLAMAAPDTGPRAPRAEIDRLYDEAEHATEAYNKATERATRLRGQVSDAQDRMARKQDQVNTMRQALGSLAGAEYRSGGMDPTLALLFSDDPGAYLDKAAALDRIGAHQAGRLREFERTVRELAQERAEAQGKLAELERSRKAVATHKRAVEGKLTAARRLLDSLPDAERERYQDGGPGDRANRSGTGLPGLTADGPAASGRAAAAVAAAQTALGSPYIWGANGPFGFDCSGLMQWSYGRAGVALPRTSQEQRFAGRRIPLSQARPGDLVAYHADASHIAMYVGNGRVIHAPHPGAPVRVDPVDMMPVSSVTRV